MRSFMIVCMFVLLFAAFLISKNLTAERQEITAERLQEVYSKDSAILLAALEDCNRWRQKSCNLDGMCDGAFWGFATLSESASCIAAETIAKEKGIDFMAGDV